MQSRAMALKGPPAFRRGALKKADGKLLRDARERANLSRRELGDRAGIGSKTIARLERGDQLPLPTTLAGLASELGVGLSDLAPDWFEDDFEMAGVETEGLRFRALRQKAGVTLEKAAAAAAVSVSTLSRFERGLHRSRGMETTPARGQGLNSDALAIHLGCLNAADLHNAIAARPMRTSMEDDDGLR